MKPLLCPCCGSGRIGPTVGNGCGDTHDCRVCHTHFTPRKNEMKKSETKDRIRVAAQNAHNAAADLLGTIHREGFLALAHPTTLDRLNRVLDKTKEILEAVETKR